jgi:FlaA1/EpsC-like NDP-sugar epimerase
MVRFGNVLDSSGSVMPLFRSQIRTGGPLTITHPEVTRYFMTVSDAAELVIQASGMTKNVSKNAQVAPVYLLDMGEPVKIIELARSMIQLSGLSVYEAATGEGDIEIKITGLRPGEKLFEELLIGGSIRNTSHPKIKVGDESFLPWSKLQVELNFLQKSMQDFDEQSVVKIMSKLVTGFVPNN